ncbi:50S ribosomal protein L18 [Aphanothece hegewaldii CCALA 016]|uniref:Large ribosomal subunit protein uL18 n=1 Tax=Aphanothece hegewaldii CCALA 016 TaxID=2107694 RepID=A0A2T1M3H9_9CHRO|nr:50S ribosomal protein L18 [Aphanothece hegewaldii]PSF39397.1 50S ribosomal protein L18 [Aphanothece hegewaldii CCALA 016]
MKMTRKESLARRHRRIRKKVNGTPERPRLCVFRSNNHIYAQVIDDTASHTLAAASTNEPVMREKLSSGATKEASAEVGRLVAKRALDKGIEQVVFDRGGNIYHGRIKSLADAAREAGLNF